jgi:hypothetical protein
MGPHMYLYEKAREVHYHDLHHQIAEKHLLALLPHHQSMSRRAAASLGILLLKLGTWLKQFEQPATTSSIEYEPKRLF